MMRIALFTDHRHSMDLMDHFQLYYAGQKKRKTFDCVFDPNRDTEFHVFSKDPKYGWDYVGTARSVRNVIPRTETHTPVWELAIEYTHSNVNERDGYVDKKTVLERVGLIPKYTCMASGIVPCS